MEPTFNPSITNNHERAQDMPGVIKREGIFAHFNPMAMTVQQMEVIANIQKEHEKNYQEIKPLDLTHYKTEPKISDTWLAVRMLQEAESQRETGAVLARLDASLLSNKQSALQLIEATPYAYPLVATKTKKAPYFSLHALERQPRIYDFLSEKERKSYRVNRVYVESTVRSVQWDNVRAAINANANTKDNIFVATYDLHPDCKKSALYYPGNLDRWVRHSINTKDDFIALEQTKSGYQLPEKPLLISKGGINNRAEASRFDRFDYGPRSVNVGGVGTVLGPTIVASAVMAQEPEIQKYYSIYRRGRLEDLLTDLGGSMLYPFMPRSEMVKTLLEDYTEQGKKYRAELAEACMQYKEKLPLFNPEKFVNQCEKMAQKQWGKDMKNALAPIASPFISAHNHVPFSEPFEVRPSEVLKCMNENPQMSRYVSQSTLTKYWTIQAAEFAHAEILLKQGRQTQGLRDDLGISIQSHKEQAKILQEVAQSNPKVAAAMKKEYDSVIMEEKWEQESRMTFSTSETLKQNTWSFDYRPAAEQIADSQNQRSPEGTNPTQNQNHGPVRE